MLKSVKAKVGKHIDHYFDFEPDMLTSEEARLNNYRKLIHRMVVADANQTPGC